jgi:hypothetical protein
MHPNIYAENPSARDHLGDLYVDGAIILVRSLEKYDVMM